MLIVLVPSNSGHCQPRQAHVVSRLLCVTSLQNSLILSGGQSWIRPGTHSTASSTLCAEVARPADIHSWMKHVYSNNCLQHTAVFDWCKRFKEGRRSTAELAHPNHPPHITDPDTHAKVKQMVQCYHCVTLWHISKHHGISITSTCKFWGIRT